MVSQNRYSYPRPGLYNVGSYQAAGRAWMTGSTDIDDGEEDEIRFPRVTKSITVISRSSVDLRVHFASTATGVGHVVNGYHYITLTESRDAMTMNVRCDRLYISNASGADDGAYEVFAELTNISSGEMHELTGSGITTLDGT